MAWPRAVALVLAPLTAAVAGAAVTAQLVAETSRFDAIEVALTTTVALMITALAVLVALREPRNALAAVMAWMGLLAAVVGFSDTYLPAQTSAPADLPPLPTTVYAFLSVTWAWVFAAVTLLFLLFPTGRPLSARWTWLVPVLLLNTAAIQVVMMTAPGSMDPPYQDLPHPFGTLPVGVSVGLQVLTFPLFMVCMLLAAASLWLRYRRGDERIRRQVKWLVLALPLLPLTLALGWGGKLIADTHHYAGVGLAAMYVAVPLATTVAVLRHDLFDVDRAVASTAVYAVLTVGVVTIYLGAATLSGALLGRQSPVEAALVAAATVVALGPARRRVQRAVDRGLYPQRRRALDALTDLERRVTSGDAVPEELEPVLRAALRSPALQVGVLAPGETRYLDSAGSEVSEESQQVVVAGETIGVIAAPEIGSCTRWPTGPGCWSSWSGYDSRPLARWRKPGPAARACRRPDTRSGDGWNAICTTWCSSAWFRSRSRCDSRSDGSPPGANSRRRRPTPSSEGGSPRSSIPPVSCAISPTGSAPVPSTTGSSPHSR